MITYNWEKTHMPQKKEIPKKQTKTQNKQKLPHPTPRNG